MSFPFNNSQLMGLDLDKHIAIDAGAGTGKTTVMAERYVQHLLAQYQRAKELLPNGPRTPLQGHGSLRAPARERTGLVEWKGLLPSEVVAITFTRKAAAELRSRIRSRLSKTDVNLHSINSGDVEMLLTSLEDAPISTIDAFLAKLVTPYLDILSAQPAGQQISEVRSPMLISETINSAWRIRTNIDAEEAGVRGDPYGFVESRNNLAILLGGQSNAETVLSGLLNTSLFVEETKRSLSEKSKDKGILWDDSRLLEPDIILDMIGEPAAEFIEPFNNQIRELLNQYIDLYMEHYSSYVLDCESKIETNKTRFNQLVELVRNAFPEDNIGKLQWGWLVVVCCTSNSSLDTDKPSHFPHGKLPNADNWHPGIHTNKANVVGPSAKQKSAISAQSNALAKQIKVLLNSNYGRLAKILGRSSYTFDPRIDLPYLPDYSTINYADLGVELSASPPIGRLRISKELQLQVLKDLLKVHRGCQEILTLRKMQEGVHDFDDIQRLAADLLLARCPDIIRYEYPTEMVDLLDDLGDEPWRDGHIARVRAILPKYPKWAEDFERRVTILQTIRQQYLAFIIDEYQDTNPAHFRLLARLWGSRDFDKKSDYHGPWDPTVCVVGDMKQSIYRFRQAEVTVMRRTVEYIKQMNAIEFANTKFEFRDTSKARDPRPILGQDAFKSGLGLKDLPKGSRKWRHLEIYADDNGQIISEDRKESRRLGHIDLTSNHRTAHDLLRTLNQMFTDVFDQRHQSLPGDWHAEAQSLIANKKDTPNGKLEWLMPMKLDKSSSQPNNKLFSDPNPKAIHLEHEMIALRLQNLIQGKACKLWNSAKREYTILEKPADLVEPNDVTILVHTRKHIADLIQRLQSRGIPVVSDRQGRLLGQPIVKNLMSALDLIAHPQSKYAAASLAKTPIMGFTDKEIHRFFSTRLESNNWWYDMADWTDNKPTTNLLKHCGGQLIGTNVHQILNEILDNSDLLYAYPDDSSRQNAELWCGLVHDIGKECGNNPAEIYAQMNILDSLGRKGPQATTIPSSGAVKIMTVHGAKGLESKVIVVSGIFQAGQYDSSITAKDNVLVTPEIISGRINPWSSINRPEDGLWQFAKSIDGAQSQAERRREFYVALTRVENHLIIVGNSTNSGALCESTGMLELTSKPSEKTMGHMWMEGLRYLAYSNEIIDSPWLNEGDIIGQPLANYGKKQLMIDPFSLYFNAQLGSDNIRSIAIFDSPNCFVDDKPIDAVTRWNMMENIIDGGKTSLSKPYKVNSVNHILRLGANTLDTSVKCRHNHWPNNLAEWNNNRLSQLLDGPKPKPAKVSNYPSPVEFGLMMHRLVEISLDNPSKYNSPPVLPLPSSWLNKPDNKLTDLASVELVMSEFGINKGDSSPAKLFNYTRKRMHQIAQLIDCGLTGIYAAGGSKHMRTAEGLRTELPFLYNHEAKLNDSSRKVLRDCEIHNSTIVRNVSILFEGRADLVMAYSDETGRGYLQVVDMKTTGCLFGFNHENPSQGTELQQFSGDLHGLYPSTESEKEILQKYQYQLTLYSTALEAIEAEKPAAERRIILPPALLIAASGRAIEMTQEEYEQCKSELAEQLSWIAELSAQPSDTTDSSRMSFQHAMSCWNSEIQ
jgi:superfamily I DNA/RNA helicase